MSEKERQEIIDIKKDETTVKLLKERINQLQQEKKQEEIIRKEEMDSKWKILSKLADKIDARSRRCGSSLMIEEEKSFYKKCNFASNLADAVFA